MIVSSLILDLETSLPGKVLTPELKEYEESIKRFSDSAVKKAVGSHPYASIQCYPWIYGIDSLI